MRLDPNQPIDEQIEWHIEGNSSQCHAWLAAVLAEDLPYYTALCMDRAPKAYILETCAPPACARCAHIVTLAGGKVPRFGGQR